MPRDLTGYGLTYLLSVLGYEITRQKGSHICLAIQKMENIILPYLNMTL